MAQKRTDRMNVHLQAEFVLQLFLNIADDLLQIVFCQQIRLAE